MASRKLEDLVPKARENANVVVEVCEQAEFDLLIYCTLRTLEEQAKLFRQSRSWEEIKKKILDFKSRGFTYLADILENAGPSYGPHVTNAAPGESWHNYGEAWDAVPLVNGKPVWNYFNARSHWDAYGECVRQVGMNWAGDWQTFREYPHAQMRPGGNPLRQLNADQILEILKTNGLYKG